MRVLFLTFRAREANVPLLVAQVTCQYHLDVGGQDYYLDLHF